MKIYLFLNDKLFHYTIPKKISGSFSFDENIDEESKLINIEARDNEWVIYSTTDVQVFSEKKPVNSASLKLGNYYILRRNNINYLIYVDDAFDNSFKAFSYSDDIELTIGNSETCNILFNCEYLGGLSIVIKKQNGNLILEKKDNYNIYLNKNTVDSPTCMINFGDSLNIYGLKIMFLNGMLLINNPISKVRFNPQNAHINFINLINNEDPQDVEIKDVDLYSKEEYFSKSPRLRRIIKTKEIKLSAPPKPEGEQQLPLILTIGPMMTMGAISLVRIVNVVVNLWTGSTTMQNAWPSLVTSVAMLLSVFLWPSLTRSFNKKLKQKRKKEIIYKYNQYLKEKGKELEEERKLQKDILIENLITVEECLPIIKSSKINFWDKRIEQSDFLEVRIGKGNQLLDVNIQYPEEGFTIDENELRKKADEMVQEYKYIYDVPIGYSLFKNKITAFMGLKNKVYGLMDNIILQLITFYSYDDVKLVLFTNEKNKNRWEYLKYLNHSFANNKSIRFFATDNDSMKSVADFLNLEIQNRIKLAENKSLLFKPYYIVIVDDYDLVRRHNFIKSLTEIDVNLGFSLLIIEDLLSKLPSKCNNFISLGSSVSGILKNSFEEQEQLKFYDEINYSINMMQISKKLSNIPIEFQDANMQIPDVITFLEMEKVGKIEQLNILNRWDTNDSTQSLKAEIGVDETGNLMYLDLHEKYHGPHGLIAGMTGSGKSEFIITYILSMAINYSPDDVAFILIDYKGGGLAGAFENKATGITLPHLAGTITNLDKAEMDRTLVSIDSEVKRRQQVFNNARDMLDESTMDIYKYQRYYKEGKLNEPIPHLFIICDEFAELKSQQPDFMDNLISVARIGRSLGVHLILATQKPSGVVNDQIWSNTKFRVCLKVQDASDSREMLKRPEAASLKQTGRFYLQVGYDEYFALGQSAWCGAKYYPSEKIIKQVDKSINFIDNIGNFIKSIQAASNIKIEAKGEQLSSILTNIIEVSKIAQKKAKRLWLNNIEPMILINDLIKEYNITSSQYDVKAILGEYDAPEKQEQGILQYSYKKNGNTIIFGNDEAEREKLLNTIVYSTCVSHSTKEINIYAIDYGSESLRMFNDFPQFGGMVFLGEDEKFKNLFKLINNEIKSRKKLLVPYGGSLENYNNKNEKKLPQILFILNNYEAISEVYPSIYEDISSIGRDCERYGIVLMITCNGPSAIGRRVGQCFENRYVLHLTDSSDYYTVFNVKCRVKPRETFGRGLANSDGIHEFQTASIVDEDHSLIEHIGKVAKELNSKDFDKAPEIPTLPEKITIEYIEKHISTINKVPIGMSKDSLKVLKYDFTMFTSTSIISNRLKNINPFMNSLLDVFGKIPKLYVFFVDTMQLLPQASKKKNNIRYFDSNIETVIEKMDEFEKNNTNENYKILYIFYGIEKIKNIISSTSKIDSLFKQIKKSENSNIIFCDSAKSLKSLDFDPWYSSIKNNTDGIWIGKGISDAQNFRLSKITKEMGYSYSNDYGFYISESSAELMKLIDFNDSLNQEEDDEDEE